MRVDIARHVLERRPVWRTEPGATDGSRDGRAQVLRAPMVVAAVFLAAACEGPPPCTGEDCLDEWTAATSAVRPQPSTPKGNAHGRRGGDTDPPPPTGDSDAPAAVDPCPTGDRDADGICDDIDLCTGDDLSGDTDRDGICDDTDPCPNDAAGDPDGDGVCGDACAPLPRAEPLAIGIWPVGDGITAPRQNDPYGPRVLNGNYDFHRGIDFPQPLGTPVRAVLAGEVVRALLPKPGEPYYDDIGNHVVLVHYDSQGNVFQTKYQHLDTVAVSTGDFVSEGQRLGTVGNTGATSYHLHLGINVGRDDGLFPHLDARSPLRILPYPAAAKTLTISKTSTELILALSQKHDSIDIVRWEIRPSGYPMKVYDIESREGMDPDDDDANPVGGLTVKPAYFNQTNLTYDLTLILSGAWASLGSCTVTLYDVEGSCYRFTQSF